MQVIISRLPRRNWLRFLVILHLTSCPVFLPAMQAQVSEIPAELKGLSPEEIERKLKELGLTREQAVREAKLRGVDLREYLISRESPGEETGQAKPGTIERPSGPPEVPVSSIPQNKPPAIPLSRAGLPYFGYDVFTVVPDAFQPAASGPADPDYLVGPGDVLRVVVWGNAEFEHELTVDTGGRIFIPTVGQVQVSGLSLEQSHNTILGQLSRSYSGLTGKTRTTWLDVSLSRLRPKRVFVMGEVHAPGGYTVNSYATVFSTLFSVGGPTVDGSLREVRVLRGGKVVAQVDLYDYLLGTETTNDIRVQNNDIVFVPVRFSTISIRGAVRRPATYELKPGEDLATLFRFAGGVLPEAYGPKVQIERIRPLPRRTGGIEDHYVMDLDLHAVLQGNVTQELVDGDLVEVFAILNVLQNYVTVRGSVWRPGRYELGSIRTIRDLLHAAEGLQPRTYTGLAHLIRYNEDQMTTRIMALDLDRALRDTSYDRLLSPRDELVVYSTEILEVKDRFVTIRGQVKNPGKYLFRDDMTMDDLIPLAGGYTEEAEMMEAEVSRVLERAAGGDSVATILHPPLPAGFLPEGGTSVPEAGGTRFLLHHRDEVLIRAKPHLIGQMNVQVTGNVVYPGTYALRRRGERITDIFERAGGTTSSAYVGGAMLYRNGERILLDFLEALEDRGGPNDAMLMAGDSIHVPNRPHIVAVEGEVNRPGLVSFIDGDNVSDYIDRAGGLTDSALYAVLTKPTGESRRIGLGLFGSDPVVPEGSTILIVKEAPPPPKESGDVFEAVKDVLALITMAATITFIVYQSTK
jgi:protein involved in polysaccharide export with SLBB domain